MTHLQHRPVLEMVPVVAAARRPKKRFAASEGALKVADVKRRIALLVARRPGITVRGVIEELDARHHYRDDWVAKSRIWEWTRRVKSDGLPGVVAVKDLDDRGKEVLRLFPKDR